MLNLFFWTCKSDKTTRVMLNNFRVQDEVRYSTTTATISVNKQDILQECEAQDNGEPNDFMYRQLARYLQESGSGPVIITDTLGVKKVTGERDNDSPYSYVLKTYTPIMMTLATKGRVQVIDRASGDTVSYIVIKKINEKDHGAIEMILPSDAVAISMLRWIR
jgi:hypothetical protein